MVPTASVFASANLEMEILKIRIRILELQIQQLLILLGEMNIKGSVAIAESPIISPVTSPKVSPEIKPEAKATIPQEKKNPFLIRYWDGNKMVEGMRCGSFGCPVQP